MRTFQIQTVHEARTASMTCNRCGASMVTRIGNIEGMVTQVQGGYDSPIVGDMNTWVFEVCEKCCEEWGQTFLVKPWDAHEANEEARLQALSDAQEPDADDEETTS